MAARAKFDSGDSVSGGRLRLFSRLSRPAAFDAQIRRAAHQGGVGVLQYAGQAA